MELKKAIDVLVSELNKDEAYRYGWQSNIAMAFFDACNQEGIQLPQLHDVSNKAANQFLRNLCRCCGNNEQDLTTAEKLVEVVTLKWQENMDLNEAATTACKEKTLTDALTYIAIWESERVLKQALESHKTKVTLSSDGTRGVIWDTCFKVCFESVAKKWQAEHAGKE